MAKGSKILDWIRLKEEAIEFGDERAKIIARFFKSHQRKIDENYKRWRMVFNPWGEIRRLRAYQLAMREEDARAARNALDLIAENETLRKYRDIAIGNLYNYVHIDDHDKLKRDLDRANQKCASANRALDKQQAEWNAFMLKYSAKKDGK